MINNRGHVLDFDDSPIGERSPLDSTTYNNIIDSLKTSTLRCLNRTRDLNDKVVKFNKALSAENTYLASRLKQFEMKYDVEANTALVTGFDPMVESQSVDVNALTGQVTIRPINKWSKVVRYTDRNGRNRASRDTYISFGPVGAAVLQPADSDIYSILDGYADTFWLTDVTDKAHYTLQIQFPVSLKPYVSYLSMIPFPAFSFSIDSIWVTKSDGSREQLADDVSQHMGILDTHFKPMSWGGTIEINFTANGNVVGISDIDIGLADYEDSVASMVFEVPAFEHSAFTKIEEVHLSDFNLYGLQNDFGYIREDRIGATVYTGAAWSPALVGTPLSRDTLTGDGSTTMSVAKVDGNKLFIKFTMQKYLAQTPIFRAVKITYGV